MSRARPGGARVRSWVVLAGLLGGLGVLGVRAVYLQVISADYLKHQGKMRYTRLVKDDSHRGMILDRSGVPLAISTPVDSVWAHPETLLDERRRFPALARLLDMSTAELARLLDRHSQREFVYLKRHVPPELAMQITALQIPGVSLVREYRRYYPVGAVAGHVIGFTNVDDQGQEGLELAYDGWLKAVPGTKRVLKDLYGTAVGVVESVRLPTPGKDLVTSLDRRVQYLAYRELKAAVEAHGARSGSAVVLDAQSGEVLALVNEPDFNPNNRGSLKGTVFRNRAVTDLYEPGSTLKPFTVVAGLESGKFTPSTLIDTSPGLFQVGGRTVRDLHNYGRISVAGVIEKSSNVGVSKIALALDKQALWEIFRRVGFGTLTGSQLPGETAGLLRAPNQWVPIDHASASYGYGISVTTLQLARAYAVLANGGELVPVTFTKRASEPERSRVLGPKVARAVREMLERVVEQGTGVSARVADYRVGGKTGTVHKLTASGYAADDYVAWFAGFAPADRPRIVMVVAIDGPRRGRHFGGDVAAPVFGHVMSGALRLLDVPPDAPRAPVTRLVAAKQDRPI